MRATSSASMPVGWMSNAWPLSISASQTLTASAHGIQISYPRSPVYPVREISTGTPAMLPRVTRKYLRLATSACATFLSSLPDVGPCRARAAVFSETSSIFTSMPSALILSQRRLGSAAVIL